jgi:hypothetical protein
VGLRLPSYGLLKEKAKLTFRYMPLTIGLQTNWPKLIRLNGMAFLAICRTILSHMLAIYYESDGAVEFDCYVMTESTASWKRPFCFRLELTCLTAKWHLSKLL